MINKKRIFNLEKYIGHLGSNESYFVGARASSVSNELLSRIGFQAPLNAGECVLPSAKFGPVSRFNAEGRYEILRDLPKETAYREVEWKWNEWVGGGKSEERSEIREVPYQRFPRKRILPPSIELKIIQCNDEYWIIASTEISRESDQHLGLHSINLFLEIFKECEILSKNLVPILPKNLKKLNWIVLPKGEYPWTTVSERIETVVSSAKRGSQPVIRSRVQAIEKFAPEFVAIGQHGFDGYIVFGFTLRNLFVLESIYPGNATYVFREDWRPLSMRTKAEILGENLQYKRFVHRDSWIVEIGTMFRENPAPNLVA